MSGPDDPLWQRLDAYQIGPPDAEFTFIQRLMRENRWSADYAGRVLGEYKRFAYLAVKAGHPVTPSDQIDQAWHLHLQYSRDYWERFCPEVLGADLHHGPTAGGQAERHRYYTQYAQTLATYEQTFGHAAPADIWSPARERFGEQPLAFRIRRSEIIFLKDREGTLSLFFVIFVMLGMGMAIGTML